MPCLPGQRRRALIAVAFITALYLFTLPTAHAQGPITTTVDEGSTTVIVPNAPAVEAPAVQEDTVFGALAPTTWDWALRLLSAAFLSALGAWAIFMVFRYVTQVQNKYYDLTGTLASRGQSTTPVMVRANTPVRPAGQPELAGAEESVLTVKGPNTITVNVESPPFMAVFQQGDQETPAGEDVTWQILPATAGTLSATTGESVRVTPKQVGAFQLIAKPNAAAADSAAVHFPVAVVAPAGGGIALPFIGEGWGTIVLAILFGLIIALLGLSRVLSTALVGTLLGALLGYIFGMVSPSLSSESRRATEPGAAPNNDDNRPG
jgi:hypothetical protein